MLKIPKPLKIFKYVFELVSARKKKHKKFAKSRTKEDFLLAKNTLSLDFAKTEWVLKNKNPPHNCLLQSGWIIDIMALVIWIAVLITNTKRYQLDIFTSSIIIAYLWLFVNGGQD